MNALPPPVHSHLALHVAQAVDRAWATAHGNGEVIVPLSVVAGLSLAQADSEEHEWDVAGPVLLDKVARHWRQAINHRPDLAITLAPLATVWHKGQPLPESAQRGAAAVARAAIKTGLVELFANAQGWGGVDLLGPVLALLRGPTAQGDRYGHYTPPQVATLVANIDSPAHARVVHEPAVGTGGLWRATAQAMRAQGRDPAETTWIGLDTDPLAVACAATNAIIWQLGHRIVLGVGDGLDLASEARVLAQRDHVLHVAEEIRVDQRLRAALEILTGEKQ